MCDEFVWICRQWCRFRAWALKKFGKFEFVKILEVTKKGRPHLHVLLQWKEGFKSLSNVVLASEWGAFVNVRRVWQGFRAVSYVIKYFHKALESHKNFDLKYAALLFASNRRMFSVSRGLFLNRVKRGPQGFVFDGVVRQSLLDSFLKESGGDVSVDFYRIGLNSSYVELFGLGDAGDG